MLDNNKRLLPPLWWRCCPVPWWPGPGECSCSEGTSCSPWPWTCSPPSPARAAADWAPGPGPAALKWWTSSQPELEPRAHWAEAFLEGGTMSPPAHGRQVTSHVSSLRGLLCGMDFNYEAGHVWCLLASQPHAKELNWIIYPLINS